MRRPSVCLHVFVCVCVCARAIFQSGGDLELCLPGGQHHPTQRGRPRVWSIGPWRPPTTRVTVLRSFTDYRTSAISPSRRAPTASRAACRLAVGARELYDPGGIAGVAEAEGWLEERDITCLLLQLFYPCFCLVCVCVCTHVCMCVHCVCAHVNARSAGVGLRTWPFFA